MKCIWGILGSIRKVSQSRCVGIAELKYTMLHGKSQIIQIIQIIYIGVNRNIEFRKFQNE